MNLNHLHAQQGYHILPVCSFLVVQSKITAFLTIWLTIAQTFKRNSLNFQMFCSL